MTVGSGEFTYDFVEGWGQLPAGWVMSEVAAVAVDAADQVYVFNRGEHPLVIFDRDGNFVASWGEGVLQDAHGLFIGPGDVIYIVDRSAHVAHKFTLDGEPLLTLGTGGRPGQDGAPFDRPTDVAVSATGDIYISDGYGNNRVHRWAANGTLIRSWGTAGTGPGEFDLPHSVWVDDERVYVADRENHRIQLFSLDGDYLAEWTGFRQPTDLYVDGRGHMYISELQSRVSIVDLDGTLLARFGNEQSTEPGSFYAPHGICTDSRGDLYVAEVQQGARVQKFARCS